VREPDLVRLSARVEQTLEQAEAWMQQAADAGLEAGARRFALTLGRTAQLALLARHAQWSLDEERDTRARAAARRFAAHGINWLADMDADDARTLARDDL
jgi:acyl-CoA dehydrogenase-like protein